MKPYDEIKQWAYHHPQAGPPNPDEGGFFRFPYRGKRLRNLAVVASWGGGWDHVSVSLPHRCPTWEEMEAVKRAFFQDDELAVQYNLPPARHVSVHPNCLHLWRPHDQEIPLPPVWMV